MAGYTLIIWVLGVAVTYTILYFVVKAAVRDAIIEARHIGEADDKKGEDTGISKIICPKCGKNHDIDFPKCPYCKRQY